MSRHRSSTGKEPVLRIQPLSPRREAAIKTNKAKVLGPLPLTAIIIDQDIKGARHMAQQLWTLNVALAGAADSTTGGVLLLPFGPGLAFLSADLGAGLPDLIGAAVTRGIAIVFVTASAAAPPPDDLLLTARSSYWIAKPVQPDRLAALIEEYRAIR